MESHSVKRDAHKLLLHSARKVIRSGRESELSRIASRAHSADLAYCLNKLPAGDRPTLFDAIEEDVKAGEVLSEAENYIAIDLLGRLSDERVSALLESVASDDRADLLLSLDDERKERILDRMGAEEQTETTSLIGYDPETAGGLMSTDTFSMVESTTAGGAVSRLQEGTDEAEVIFYIYVVNEHGQLVGVTSLRELVRQAPGTPLSDFMITDVIRVHTETDQEEVARLVARYNLLALPVVEANNQLVGVVTVDDIIDVIRLEATEDMMRMAGAETDVGVNNSPFGSIRARIPWLLPAFIAGALGIFVVQGFEQELAQFLPLVALIPIIMGMAGNVGIQSSTVVTRGIAIGRLDVAALSRMVLRETFVGLVAGFVYGAAAALLIGLVFSSHMAVEAHGVWLFAAVAGISMTAAAGLAAALGAAVPMVFARVGLDPSMATGPFVTTTIDVSAVAVYLVIATSILVG